MTSHVQHRRSLVPGNVPANMAQGELALNIADRRLFTSDTGNPLPLIGVRVWADTAKYAINDIVAYQGATWRATVAHGPAAWNAANWATTADANTQAMIDASLLNYVGKPGGAGNAMTGPLQLAAGSQAAPSLAFSAEPGLGFFRSGPGVIRSAMGGAAVFNINASSPSITYVTVIPRTDNMVAALQAFGNLTGTKLLQLQADGGTNQASILGAGLSAVNFTGFDTVQMATSNLVLNAPVNNVYQVMNRKGTVGGNVIWAKTDNVNNWGLVLTAGGAAGDFQIDRYDNAGAYAGTPFTITRANGNTWVQNTLTVGAAVVANQHLLTNNEGAWGKSGSVSYFQYAAGWAWNFDHTTGAMTWLRGSGQPSTIFGANGDFHGGRNIFPNNNGNPALIGDNAGYPFIRFSSDNWRLQYTSANGNLDYVNFQNAQVYSFEATGNARKMSGAGDWLGISDISVKRDVAPFEYGLDACLKLQPIWYRYKSDPDDARIKVAFSAQQAREVIPEMVFEGDDGLLVLDTTALKFTTLNAIKTLHERITALETSIH